MAHATNPEPTKAVPGQSIAMCHICGQEIVTDDMGRLKEHFPPYRYLPTEGYLCPGTGEQMVPT